MPITWMKMDWEDIWGHSTIELEKRENLADLIVNAKEKSKDEGTAPCGKN